MPADDPAAYDAMTTEQMGGSLKDQLDALASTVQDIEPEPMPGTEGMEGIGDAPVEEAATALEDETGQGGAADAEGAIAAVMASAPASPGEFLSALREQGFDLVQSAGAAAPTEPIMPEVPTEAPMRDARRAAAERAFGGTA